MRDKKTKNGVVIDEATRHFVIAAIVIAKKAKIPGIPLPSGIWPSLEFKLTMNGVELPLTETCNRFFSDLDRIIAEQAAKRLRDIIKDVEYLRENSEELAKRFAEMQGKLENAEKDEYDQTCKLVDDMRRKADD